MHLPNCWEIKQCGRASGGAKTGDLGECIASREKLGRSCWAIAGTLCGGAVQGTVAQKEKNCMSCDVYKLYNRAFGSRSEDLLKFHPDEQERYIRLMHTRMNGNKR